MIALALSSLLGACATDNVVVTPVGLANVNPALLKIPKKPACNLPEQEGYTGRQLNSRGDCWEAAYKNVESKLVGLVRATVSRETALANVLKKGQ